MLGSCELRPQISWWGMPFLALMTYKCSGRGTFSCIQLARASCVVYAHNNKTQEMPFPQIVSELIWYLIWYLVLIV